MLKRFEQPLQTPASQLAAASELFHARFKRPPRFAARAPGRVNLIGEHTDYNLGFVLPMAIERYTLVVADPSPNDSSTFWSFDLDETTHVDLTSPLHPLPGTAANYPLGVASQFLKRQDARSLGNFDVLITSTVPLGAGLSSSAALEVAFATLLEQATGAKLSVLEKALLCQAAEHEFPGAPVGIMDMYISAGAQRGNALLIDCRSNHAQAVPLPSTSKTIVLIVDSGVKHSLAAGEYAKRRATCESAARKLGVPSLREATITMLNTSNLSLDERMKALHVVAENNRTVLAAEALGSGDVTTFGELMFASHDSLRDLFDVSCRELNVLVDAARTRAGQGVFGARMTGGGFGGCVVILCKPDSVSEIRDELNAAFRDVFGRTCEMFTTVAAGGAQALNVEDPGA